MLANAIVYVALIALVATTFLSAGLAMVRTAIHRSAQTYVTPGFQRAASALQQTLAQDLRTGTLPAPLPTFTPMPPACVDANTPCRYKSSASITLTQTGTAVAGSQCDAMRTNCAAHEQSNAYVRESRITARISVSITAASDGALLATRTADLIVRTMNTPPYAVLAGNRDGSFDDAIAAHAAGDDGGTLPATPNPCATAVAGASDDTAIRVAYRNQTTNACSDGNSWRTESYDSSTEAATWSP